MKIVHFVLSDSFAGIEQHVDEVLTNFSSHKLILICNESIASYFDKSINIYKIKNFGRRSFFGKYQLKKLIKDIDPDIIHTHGSKTSSIISSIKTKNYKHVATIHGVKKNKKIYEKADLIIGVSDKALEGINHEKICINNWWHPKLKKIQNKKNKHALAVGRLEKVKGFDLLITSWKNIDANLCMFHDQALIPIKSSDFYGSINFTAGLPFIRTSPDHGTAFDIAGKGIAQSQSMVEAIKAAIEMTKNSRLLNAH